MKILNLVININSHVKIHNNSTIPSPAKFCQQNNKSWCPPDIPDSWSSKRQSIYTPSRPTNTPAHPDITTPPINY